MTSSWSGSGGGAAEHRATKSWNWRRAAWWRARHELRRCPRSWASGLGGAAGLGVWRGPGFRSRSIRCGSSPMTLPGLSWPSGSKASLISRKTCASSPYCLAKELGAREPAGLRAADRAAGVEHDVVDPRSQRLEPGAIAGVGKIEERPQAKPPVARAGVERPCDVLLLEHALKPLRAPRRVAGRHGHIVDDRDRPRPAARPHEQRLDQPAQPEQAIAFRAIERDERLRDEHPGSGGELPDLLEFGGDRVRVIALEFDRQDRFGRLVDPAAERQRRRHAPGESDRRSNRSHEDGVERPVPGSPARTPRRRADPANASSTTPCAAAIGIGAQHRLERDAQRSFRAREQSCPGGFRVSLAARASA